MGDRSGFWGKNNPIDNPAVIRTKSSAISLQFDRNRPKGMEKCIGCSLNSKKPWRTNRLSEEIVRKFQNALLDLKSCQKSNVNNVKRRTFSPATKKYTVKCQNMCMIIFLQFFQNVFSPKQIDQCEWVRSQRVFGAERATDTFFQRLWSVPVDSWWVWGGLLPDYQPDYFLAQTCGSQAPQKVISWNHHSTSTG